MQISLITDYSLNTTTGVLPFHGLCASCRCKMKDPEQDEITENDPLSTIDNATIQASCDSIYIDVRANCTVPCIYAWKFVFCRHIRNVALIASAARSSSASWKLSMTIRRRRICTGSITSNRTVGLSAFCLVAWRSLLDSLLCSCLFSNGSVRNKRQTLF